MQTGRFFLNCSRWSTAPGGAAATLGNNSGELGAPRDKRWIQQTWQKWAFLKYRVFYSCVLTHYLYFMVEFSLYTENKVIIFSPFLDVCKCIAVGF